MKSPYGLSWISAKLRQLRTDSGRDATKFEALTRDPEIEREAREKFPDDPALLQVLQYLLDDARLLARNGFFPDDSDPSDEL